VQERLVENWLISVNEKSFQIPFCQLLTGEGYQVVHISRHGPFEQGKDVLAIDPEGNPCAFQLKGSTGKISQKEWGKNYVEQAIRLVETPIVHPSIDEEKPRKVFFVTNGELDEEVRLEISDRNRDWDRRGLPSLTTIVKGELLTRFLNLHNNLWPKELSAYKTLLELFLADGSGYLDKQKFSGFLLELLNIDYASRAERVRALSSLALATSYSINSFVEKKNYVAIIEAWVIYLSSLISFVTKHEIQEKYWKANFDLALEAIDQAFSELIEELLGRPFLVEGNPIVDALFYRGRTTWLSGLISAYALWKKTTDKENWSEESEGKVYAFISANKKYFRLWGEGAVPQLLSISWYLYTCGVEHQASGLIDAIIRGIISTNVNPEGVGLADPYHGLGEVIINSSGLSDTLQKENFKGRSYFLNGIIHLLTRWGWRGVLEEHWPQITRIDFVEYKTDEPWKFCLWHTETGKLTIQQPKYPKSWSELKKEAQNIDLTYIPEILIDNPALLVLISIVFPHRVTKDVIKLLDEKLLAE
jgi:hypothetical protein